MEILLSFIRGAPGALSSQFSDSNNPHLLPLQSTPRSHMLKPVLPVLPRPCFPMCAEQSQCRALLGELWGLPDKGVPCYTVTHPSMIGPSRPWQENEGTCWDEEGSVSSFQGFPPLNLGCSPCSTLSLGRGGYPGPLGQLLLSLLLGEGVGTAANVSGMHFLRGESVD